MFRRRVRDDRGAAVMEYAALIVLGALILGALVPAVVPSIKGNVEYALCKIFHPGEASQCESPADKEYKPQQCMLSRSTNTYGASVEVLFFKVGKDLTFMRTTTVDNDGHKKVVVTAVDNTTLGVGTGVGVGVHGGKAFNLGADATIGADLKIGIGDSWTFDGDDPEGKADKFIGDIQEYAGIKAVENSGPLGWLAGHAYDAIAGPDDLPDPDTTRTEFSLNVNGGVSAGLGIGPPNKGGQKPKGKDKYDHRGDNKGYSSNASASLVVDGSEKGVIEEHSDGSSSVTLMLSGKVTGTESHVTGGHSGSLGSTGSIKVSKDKNGTITGMDLTRATIVGGKTTWTTTHLPLTNDKDRQAVADYLISDAGTQLGQTTLNLTWDDMAPTDPPGPDANPLQKLLYEKGQTTKQDYTYDATAQSYGLDVKLGVKLGFGVSATGEEQKLTSAQYLGAPGPDGVRRYKDYKECHE